MAANTNLKSLLAKLRNQARKNPVEAPELFKEVLKQILENLETVLEA